MPDTRRRKPGKGVADTIEILTESRRQWLIAISIWVELWEIAISNRREDTPSKGSRRVVRN